MSDGALRAPLTTLKTLLHPRCTLLYPTAVISSSAVHHDHTRRTCWYLLAGFNTGIMGGGYGTIPTTLSTRSGLRMSGVQGPAGRGLPRGSYRVQDIGKHAAQLRCHVGELMPPSRHFCPPDFAQECEETPCTARCRKSEREWWGKNEPMGALIHPSGSGAPRDGRRRLDFVESANFVHLPWALERPARGQPGGLPGGRQR